MSQKRKTIVHEVGPDKFDSYDWKEIDRDKYVAFIVWYELGSYEGNGLAVGVLPDGTVEFDDVSHCSCYGPTERWGGAKHVPAKQFLYECEVDTYFHRSPRKRTSDDYDFERWDAVGQKFRRVYPQLVRSGAIKEDTR
jgi:hypothetical protein